ncbi:MAG: hypothetical protein QM644_03250 [Mobilitalea sp.]
MKLKRSYIRIIVGLVMTFFMIFIMPYLIFLVQDAKLIDKIKHIKINPISVSSKDNSELELEDKLNLIEGDTNEVERVELKMGEVYSLYEARKQCFDELCKIPILQMDTYGPIRDEIDITPILFINTGTPSHTMIAWTGSVTIKDVTYNIALDEKSEKLILLQVVKVDTARREELQDAIDRDWKNYLE